MMAISIGIVIISLIALFVLNIVNKKHQNKVITIIVSTTLLLAAIVSASVIAITLELNFGLITNRSFSNPVFYITHLPLLVAFCTGLAIYIRSMTIKPSL